MNILTVISERRASGNSEGWPGWAIAPQIFGWPLFGLPTFFSKILVQVRLVDIYCR